MAYVPDHFKTQEICDKGVWEDSSFLQYVPDWFVTWEWVDMWHDDYYDDDGGHWDDDDDDDNSDDNEDKSFEWYEKKKKRKAQKASIKEELLPIAWLPSRYWDWCMSEDEKKSLMSRYKNFLKGP